MQKLLLFCRAVGRNFIKDGCFYRASSLAYTSLLAVVPLMAIGLMVTSYFPFGKLLGKRIEDFVFHNLIASSGKILQAYITGFSQQVLRIPWFGIVALMVIIVILLFSMENTLNCIWKLPLRRRRFALLRSLARQWFTLILIPLLLVFSLALSSYFSSLMFVSHVVQYVNAPSFSLYILPTLFVFFAFTAMYKFIPATKVRLRDAYVGALVGTILFHVSKKLFVLYISFFPTYMMLYGAFAVIPLFLIWIYLVWLIILLGAEISWLLGVRRTTVN
mgnify:CR=1 FL=1